MRQSGEFFALLALLLAFSLCVPRSSASLIVNGTNGEEIFYAPSLYFPGMPQIPVAPSAQSMQLVFEPNVSFAAWTDLAVARYKGNIVFIRNWDEPKEEDLFRWLEKASMHAAILILPFGPQDSGIGYPEFVLPSVYNIKISCPTLTISLASSNRLITFLDTNSSLLSGLSARIDKDDGITPVRQWLSSGLFWFFSIFSAASSCFVSAYAVVKFIDYIRFSGHRNISVVMLCIIMEFCGSFIRFLNWSIDSLGARQLTTQHGSGSWRSASLPFTIASTLLLTFYWHETLSRTSLRISLNVSHFKIPCYILIALCFVVEITIDTIRITVHNLSNFWRSANAVFYVTVAAGLSIFYIVTATRIFLALKRSSKTVTNSTGSSHGAQSAKEDRRRNHLKETTIKLLGSGIFLGIMVFVAPTSLLPYYAQASMSHVGYIVFWVVATFLVNGKAITTLAAFNTAHRSESKDSSTGVERSTRSATSQQSP